MHCDITSSLKCISTYTKFYIINQFIASQYSLSGVYYKFRFFLYTKREKNDLTFTREVSFRDCKHIDMMIDEHFWIFTASFAKKFIQKFLTVKIQKLTAKNSKIKKMFENSKNFRYLTEIFDQIRSFWRWISHKELAYQIKPFYHKNLCRMNSMQMKYSEK
jgi:hypothetical protein